MSRARHVRALADPPDGGTVGKGIVTIVGAGLAGCWLTRELVTRGRRVRLIEGGPRLASGASGNAVGIIKPVVSRQPSRPEAFYREAFAHLCERLADSRLSAACELQRTGALQLVRKPFPDRPGAEAIDAAEASRRAGLCLPAPALAFERGAWLRPAALCRALIEPLEIDLFLGTSLSDLVRRPGGWELTLADGSMQHAEQVVLASGPAVTELTMCSHLPITAARGQMDRFALGGLPRPLTVLTGRSWMIPDGDAVWAGATYGRDDTDDAVRERDTAHNRAALDALSGTTAGEALTSCAAVRATLPDRLPCVGPITDPVRQDDGDGLSVLTGFGSRGIVTTAFCARMLADYLCGDASSLRRWHDLLSPQRFAKPPPN